MSELAGQAAWELLTEYNIGMTETIEFTHCSNKYVPEYFVNLQ